MVHSLLHNAIGTHITQSLQHYWNRYDTFLGIFIIARQTDSGHSAVGNSHTTTTTTTPTPGRDLQLSDISSGVHSPSSSLCMSLQPNACQPMFLALFHIWLRATSLLLAMYCFVPLQYPCGPFRRTVTDTTHISQFLSGQWWGSELAPIPGGSTTCSPPIVSSMGRRCRPTYVGQCRSVMQVNIFSCMTLVTTARILHII